MKLRAVIGLLPGDPYPIFAGAADAGLWEVISEEEWQDLTLKWKQWATGNDAGSYDWREVFVEFEAQNNVFEAPTLQGKAA